MKTYPAMIRWSHSFGFRAGEWATIVSVHVAEPDGLKPRLCYGVMYEDGTYDSIPISDSDNYEIKADKVASTEIKVTLKIEDATHW